MRYREYTPSPAASAIVHCYWSLDGSGTHADVQRIVPDGRPELIVNLGQPFQSCARGQWDSQPRRFFAGQITGPMVVRPDGAARMWGIRFHPHGARRIFGAPMSEFTGRVLAVDEIDPRLDRELACIDPSEPPETQVRHFDRIFTRMSDEDAPVRAAVDCIIRAGGVADLNRIAGMTGFSRRQFERRFAAEVGIAPKLFCRIQRFQRVFHAIEREGRWAETAVECGYFDQAHLIRDVRRFAGATPRALLGEGTDLARHFIART